MAGRGFGVVEAPGPFRSVHYGAQPPGVYGGFFPSSWIALPAYLPPRVFASELFSGWGAAFRPLDETVLVAVLIRCAGGRIDLQPNFYVFS